MRDIDVVVINYRPDVAARLGIDYETLAAHQPHSIYVDNTAFGRAGRVRGPARLRHRRAGAVRAHRHGRQAERRRRAGRQASRRSPTRRPVTRSHAPYAQRCSIARKTGKGQKIETSLLINALMINNVPLRLHARCATRKTAPVSPQCWTRQAKKARGTGTCWRRTRHALRLAARATSTTAASSPAMAPSPSARSRPTCASRSRKVLEVEHNRDDPATTRMDPAQREVDVAIIAKQSKRRSLEAAASTGSTRFEAGGVPVSKRQLPADHDRPSAGAGQRIRHRDRPRPVGQERLAAPPWKMSESPPQAQGASPPLGRDNDAILASAGYSEGEIAALRGKGVIR